LSSFLLGETLGFAFGLDLPLRVVSMSSSRCDTRAPTTARLRRDLSV
jgi:hypothetical protein